MLVRLTGTVLTLLLLATCEDTGERSTPVVEGTVADPFADQRANAISEPLVTDLYTADPSAHVFNGRVYIYPSHDVETGIENNDDGEQFAMRDYHVYSMDSVGSEVTDHGVALDVDDVPWATRQLWAPDAAERNGKYYLFLPGRDSTDRFRIGVATSNKPEGPFTAEPNYIEGTYSIDPAVYAGTDGSYYLYFGGIWGGQLQKYRDNQYAETNELPDSTEAALPPRVARLSDDMRSLAETPRAIEILDTSGQPLVAGDSDRRFFEAAWVHKVGDTYYFSYSTGDTHFICYATGEGPYGPFTYRGHILEPVVGWTNHHSIVEIAGKWYLFYHDSLLSDGATHLRSIKMTELTHLPDGTIETIQAYGGAR